MAKRVKRAWVRGDTDVFITQDRVLLSPMEKGPAGFFSRTAGLFPKMGGLACTNSSSWKVHTPETERRLMSLVTGVAGYYPSVFQMKVCSTPSELLEP